MVLEGNLRFTAEAMYHFPYHDSADESAGATDIQPAGKSSYIKGV
jgi:hypothetical protein